jgi:squalene-hopene/tetraprenyl-beta-curcumene cyclase
MRHAALWIGSFVLALLVAAPASAIDEAHRRQAEEMIDRAIDYLRSQQHESGGWSVRENAPVFPGITALATRGLIMQPEIGPDDPAVSRAVDFMLDYAKPSGGIYDRVLASYNTSICLSALALVEREDAAAAIKPAQDFLRSIQWSEESIDHPETGEVDPSHPFYGGVGYGGSSRPDNSNLNKMLQGLKDSGLSSDDPAFQRALTFLERTQMHDSINDMPYADGSTQGGFIYATSPSGDEPGAGESKAGMITETTPDGRRIERLRAYGSMTYAGFKSYLYANLDRDDPRVQLAYDWIRRHYMLEENPGMGMQGYYYYLLTFSRALDAWGLPTIEIYTEDGVETRDWANDLVDQLAKQQNPDGSFKVEHPRWMEDNPVLITSYALLALQEAIR